MTNSSGSSLWFTVLATAAITAGLVETYHRYILSTTSSSSSSSSSSTSSPPTKRVDQQKEHSEELIREQLARNYAFLSDEGMTKVRNQRIVLVGAGGVGSWVATMLIRSGVENLKIIDFDQVSLSSLNRHAVATLADVGISKVDCLKNHLLQICPWANIVVKNQLWNINNSNALIYGEDGEDDFNPTYVIDCIDNIDTKVDLLTFCYENKLPVISSGGAACKSDPTRINISDISKTEEDPLARSVRIRLKKRGILTNIPVVFSAEKPDPRKAQLLPLSTEEIEKGSVDQLAALQNFRVRILPVLGTMPGMFGLTIATYLITSISGYPIEPIEGKNRYKIYDGMLQSLAGQQSRIGKLEQRIPISLNDVPYILEEIYRGKSPISNYSTRLTLSRWDPAQELSFQNVVIMTKEEQKAHEDSVLNGGKSLTEFYSQDILDRVEQRFKEEKYYSQFR
ncbi:ubiquitin--protein ligase molybdopterin-converting factor [Scheffersomyces coipomensis]|uniref:ubiquitin--protein ligase molybdopterin-converting factor n=1 Tax=Scheffersomyces coipomensis TaxID=1788519 RepID=UPI00315D0FC3